MELLQYHPTVLAQGNKLKAEDKELFIWLIKFGSKGEKLATPLEVKTNILSEILSAVNQRECGFIDVIISVDIAMLVDYNGVYTMPCFGKNQTNNNVPVEMAVKLLQDHSKQISNLQRLGFLIILALFPGVVDFQEQVRVQIKFENSVSQ
jgi:hypothetical protein